MTAHKTDRRVPLRRGAAALVFALTVAGVLAYVLTDLKPLRSLTVAVWQPIASQLSGVEPGPAPYKARGRDGVYNMTKACLALELMAVAAPVTLLFRRVFVGLVLLVSTWFGIVVTRTAIDVSICEHYGIETFGSVHPVTYYIALIFIVIIMFGWAETLKRVFPIKADADSSKRSTDIAIETSDSD